MKYTKLPSDAFTHLQLNAGILVDDFTPASGLIGNILGATSGGINFNSNPSYSDWGEDVDNCPAGMLELKHLDGYDPTMSGNFLTCTPAVIKKLNAAADISVSDSTKVVPRNNLLNTDFTDLWWIGDYSDVNDGQSAGFLAIHLMNALNQSGFQIQSNKNSKSQMAFEFHGHYSMSSQDVVPFEIYCKEGSSSTTPFVELNYHTVNLTDGDKLTLTANTYPANATVTWTSGSTSVASVSAGEITAEGEGNTIVTASITQDGVTYTDTCTVIVAAAN